MAMITAILISVVVLGLAVVATGVAVHNSSQSGRDRTRLQTIDAAEAGLSQTALKIEGSAPTSLPCTLSGDLDANPPVRYQVTITYYATYPPSGSPMSCPPTAPPAGATVASVGTSTVGSQTPRKMVSQVRLRPRYGGFDTAIFSYSRLDLRNNLDILGDQGNDADVYTNGNVDCDNSMVLEGSLLAQGGVTMGSSCAVAEDVYAKGAIAMSNSSRVGHDAKSSRDNISLANSAEIANSATARGTITLSGNARIGGSRTQGYTSMADPPIKTLPTINYNPSDWSSAGYTIQTDLSCSSAKSFLDALPNDGRDYVVRIAADCLLQWSNNSTITVRQNVAIIYDGQVGFVNQVEWRSGDGEDHAILFINPASTSGTCTSRNPAFSTSNNTSFADQLTLFVYTPCEARFDNSNNIKGQVMADLITIANSFDLYFAPVPVPGFGDVAGFDQDIAFQREVAP